MQTEKDEIIKGQRAAAAYAGVSVRTIRNWKAEGMPLSQDGCYIKSELRAFKRLKRTDRVFITKDGLKTLIGQLDSASDMIVGLKTRFEKLLK